MLSRDRRRTLLETETARTFCLYYAISTILAMDTKMAKGRTQILEL